jgi:hypothetical protein
MKEGSKNTQEILVKRMINICKNYLTNTGKVREGTAVLLAKLLTRPDVIKAGETDLVLKSLAESYVQGRDDSSQINVFCFRHIANIDRNIKIGPSFRSTI